VLAKEYTRRYPERFEGWMVVADLAGSFARYDEAARALRRSEVAARGGAWRRSPALLFAQQWGEHYLWREDYPRAERWWRRAASGAVDPVVDAKLGAILILRGDLDGALDCLTRAIAANPRDEAAHYNRGLVELARGRYTEAARALRRALRLSPAYPIATLALRDVERAQRVREHLGSTRPPREDRR
jgi:tetratricopeptide (TPR) repeat protein